MRLLITGGRGQLGRALRAARAGRDDVYAPGRDELDLTDPEGVRAAVADFAPDLIVHAGALTDVDGCETRVEEAFRINAFGARVLALLAAARDLPLVYVSTNYVFDGARPNGEAYHEWDRPAPLSVYGLSKLAGEEIAHGYYRRCGLRVCSLRPPWVIHPEQYEREVRPRLQGPQDWASVLFTYVDVRDLAVAYRLALEAAPEVVQDEVFNIAADDAVALEPLAEILPRLDPAFGELAAGLTGRQPMVSAERIKRQLGWRPRHSWRDAIEA